MGKSLKLLVAGLRKIGEYQLVDSNIADDSLPQNFKNTSSDVRAVLCYFSVSLFSILIVVFKFISLSEAF